MVNKALQRWGGGRAKSCRFFMRAIQSKSRDWTEAEAQGGPPFFSWLSLLCGHKHTNSFTAFYDTKKENHLYWALLFILKSSLLWVFCAPCVYHYWSVLNLVAYVISTKKQKIKKESTERLVPNHWHCFAVPQSSGLSMQHPSIGKKKCNQPCFPESIVCLPCCSLQTHCHTAAPMVVLRE